MSRGQDLACLLKSLQLIAEASCKLQEENIKFIWKNSSLFPTLEACASKVKNATQEVPKNAASLGVVSKECVERVSTVFQGLSAYRNLPGAGMRH